MATFNDDDRAMLRDSVERFGVVASAPERRRNPIAIAEGYSDEVWREFAELGLLGLCVPENRGGAGGAMLEIGIVMSMIGRRLLVEPYLNTAVICAPMLAELDPSGAACDLASVISGKCIVAFAHTEAHLGFARGPIATAADSVAGGYQLSGTKCGILDARAAGALLVTAMDSAGEIGVFLVARERYGETITDNRSVDGRNVGTISFDRAPAVRVGSGDASVAIGAALDRAIIALSFEASGAMDELVSVTTEHVKTRRAFGGTLSQFQVVKHRLVDMLMATRETEAIAEFAAAAYDRFREDKRMAAAIAKIHGARSARFVAQNAVQLHGGLGVSDELSVSHHFKRLMMSEALFGNAEHHLGRYVAMSYGAEAPIAKESVDAR